MVVYKVDRLTRSLPDFARIVEIFDANGVSFVSVTQQFNTTSSMGRLTLNVLLSFAQFEREVTGERIRDKIAASKKKGMWMGGQPPLGYDVKDRKLVVNAAEAETVRHIFRRYVELESVRLLKAGPGCGWDRQQGPHGARTAAAYGGKPLARGALYLMLQNRDLSRRDRAQGQAAIPASMRPSSTRRFGTRCRPCFASNRVERADREARQRSQACWPAFCSMRRASG